MTYFSYPDIEFFDNSISDNRTQYVVGEGIRRKIRINAIPLEKPERRVKAN